MRRKRNYAMEKLNVPKRVTLPNGRTFVARYKRISRDELPLNIQMRRVYRQRAAPRGRRRRQRGQGFGSFFKKIGRVGKKAFKVGKKAVNSRLGRKISKALVSEIPHALEKLSGRIKNEKIKRILNSDLAKTGTDYATSLALEHLDK